MQDPKIWIALSKHLSGEETPQEKEAFINWLNESEKNKELFNKAKKVWDTNEVHLEQSLEYQRPKTFREKFTKEAISNFLLKEALGNFIGFVVGMWVTVMFSHHVLERKSLKNLFGFAGRKKVVVNDIPEWLQGAISIIVGFIALELINHFFQTKKHLLVLDYIKRTYGTFKSKFQV